MTSTSRLAHQIIEITFQYAQMFYYIGFVNIVQFGWAAVQISHMAMITELVNPFLAEYL